MGKAKSKDNYTTIKKLCMYAYKEKYAQETSGEKERGTCNKKP